MNIRVLFIISLLSSILHAEEKSSPNSSHPLLYPAAWSDTSVEYQASVLQTYVAARARLDEALADPQFCALPQLNTDFAQLPPAIILDLDETVISNGPFDSYLVRHHETYDPAAWRDWVTCAEAEALPGVIEFLQECHARGIHIFYVTNRLAEEEADTRRNLHTIGAPLPKDYDCMLMRNEQENWPSDKSSRRELIAQSHRVIMLFGDDFNDFVSARNQTPTQREQLFTQHAEHWGIHWFLLPNPVYGSWEESLFEGDYSIPETKRQQLMIDALKAWEPHAVETGKDQ